MWLMVCFIQFIYFFAATDALSNISNGLELRRQTGTSCILPKHPDFGFWVVSLKNTNFEPGMSVNESQEIIIDCQPGYTLNGNRSATCAGGRWIPKLGECLASSSTRNDTVPKVSSDEEAGCFLPDYPLNGGWTVEFAEEDLKPGEHVPSLSILVIRCDDNYKLEGDELGYCEGDRWLNISSKCLKPCPPLQSTESTKIICSNENKDLEDCLTPVNGTIARFECGPFYENTNFLNPFTTCKDGFWTNSGMECTPICGEKLEIDGGNQTYQESNPWHVAVYDKTKKFVCGGTLISQRTVLTAAACVANLQEQLEPTENFIVAVGKHYRNYDHPSDIVSAQFSKLEAIYIPVGPLNVRRDTALLVTKTSFKLSQGVQPACVDRSSSSLYIPSSLGYSAIWKNELMEIPVPLADSAGCSRIKNLIAQLCANSLNASVSRCQGEKGVGLFAEYQNKNYVMGVAIDPPIGGGKFRGDCGDNYGYYIGVQQIDQLLSKLESDFERNGTTKQTENECLLPLYPENGQWSLIGSHNSLAPGDFVPSGFIMEITCSASYILHGSKFLKCANGQWNSTAGTCLAPCPPITSSRSIQVSCSSGNSNISCSNGIHGTVVVFKCNPFYENLELIGNPFRVCQNGEWKPEIPTCVPMCGVKPESEEGKNYNPWNVAIYQVDGQNRTLKCAGTLINERIVLTSAQCISDDLGTKFSPKNYLVAAGESAVNDNAAIKTEVQYSELEDISINNDYGGRLRYYWADIALLVTKQSFNMSKNVQLACIDWNQKLNDSESLKLRGFIPAPLTSRDKEKTDIKIPIVDINKCNEQLSVNSSFVTFDKICSGVVNLDQTSKCKINRGVGLVSKLRFDNRYYLVGIASVFFPSNCDADENYILFTQVSKHISNFIAEKNKLYTPVNTPYFQSFCGVKSVQAQTLIVGGHNVSRSEYPWQVAIYKTKPNGRKILICGGALINQRIILTAAHCVTDRNGRKLPLPQFTVAVGKYYRQFDHDDDTDSAQFSELLEIIVSPQYEGEPQNYVGDIALLISEKSFILSKHVQPVCVDWEEKYESSLLKNAVTGYVSGWGYTKQNRDPSEILKDLKVQYVDQNSCKNGLPPDYDVYLTFDKICSGFLNGSASVCRGDSGGGLVFRNEIDGRYYIFGVVSLSPQAPSGGCNIQTYALYTKVSYYLKDFILKNAKLYWR